MVTPFLKSAERLLRLSLIAVLRFAGSGARRRHMPEDPAILLIRTDRLGDALISIPVIRLLRGRFPKSQIDLLLGPKNAAVASLLPGLDTIDILPGQLGGIIRTIHALRNRRYDIGINLVANDSVTALIATLLSGATARIGFEGKASGLYTTTVQRSPYPVHIVRETSLLLGPLGIPPISKDFRTKPSQVFIQADVPGNNAATTAGIPTVVLNISASTPEKFLGIANYAEVAGELERRGYRVMIASAPQDRDTRNRIALIAGCGEIPEAATFSGFAENLISADIIVTPDTSVSHLGAGMGKRVVVLAASKSAAACWYPWGVDYRMINNPVSVQNITPAEIVDAVLSLLAANHQSPVL